MNWNGLSDLEHVLDGLTAQQIVQLIDQFDHQLDQVVVVVTKEALLSLRRGQGAPPFLFQRPESTKMSQLPDANPRQVDDLLSHIFGLVPFASGRAAGQWRRGSQRPADFKFQRKVGASAAAATPRRLVADEFDELLVEPVVFQIPPLECVLELILFEVGVARQLADVFTRLLQCNFALTQTHRHLSLFFN